MKRKSVKRGGLLDKKADRRRKEEEEYGRDEFLFGAADEEEYDEEEYYEDDEDEYYSDEYYPEDSDDEDESDDDYDSDEEYLEDENYEEVEELPDFDPEDPDFFTRDIDTDAVAAGVAAAAGGAVAAKKVSEKAADVKKKAKTESKKSKKSDKKVLDKKSKKDKIKSKKKSLKYEDDEYYSDEEYSDEEEYYEDEAYSDEEEYYEDEEYSDEDEYYEDEEYYEDDEDFDDDYESGHRFENSRGKKSRKTNRRNKRHNFFSNIVYFFVNMSTVDRLIASTGICVLVIAIVAGSIFVNARNLQAQIDEFAEIGSELNGVNIIGENGLNAVASAKANFIEIPEEIFEEETIEEELPVVSDKITVSLKVTTIQSDLKIKFNNKDTGKNISGIKFAATIEGDNGKTYNWTDEDKDGLIYHTDVPNGTYKITMDTLEGDEYSNYVSSTETISVKVSDTIQYKKVDVSDEVKTEAEVNVAAEDTAAQNTAVESVNTDTVEWVESTKTLISGSEDEYEEVDKSKISQPSSSIKGVPDAKDVEIIASSYTYEMPVMGAGQITVVRKGDLGDGPQDPPGDGGAGDTPGGDDGGAGDTPGGDNGNGGAGDTPGGDNGNGGAGDTPGGDNGNGGAGDTPGGDNGNGGAGDTPGGDSGNGGSDNNKPDPKPETKPDPKPEKTPEKDLSASISQSEIKVTEGEGKKTLEVTAGGGSGDYTYSWETSNDKVAKISGSGSKVTVEFVGSGSATITVTIKSKVNGESKKVTATSKIEVAKKDASKDNKTPLETTSGKQVYIKNSEGKFVKATAADYATAKKFYVAKESSNAVYKYTGWQTIDGYTYFFDKNGNYVTGEQVIQGAKYSFDSSGHLSSGSGTMGIDVSKWNGNIDWKAVKNSGVSYVIIRCGYRGSTTGALIEDPKFRANISGAKAAGLQVGAYFFTQAVSEAEAVEEASMAVSLCSGYGLNLPIFLDVEGSGGRGDSIGADMRTAVCKAFCQTVQNSGFTAGIYANKTWLTSYMHASQLTSYKIWLAQYAATPTYTSTRYDYWQYSSKGSVAGISGNVDLNLRY